MATQLSMEASHRSASFIFGSDPRLLATILFMRLEVPAGWWMWMLQTQTLTASTCRPWYALRDFSCDWDILVEERGKFAWYVTSWSCRTTCRPHGDSRPHESCSMLSMQSQCFSDWCQSVMSTVSQVIVRSKFQAVSCTESQRTSRRYTCLNREFKVNQVSNCTQPVKIGCLGFSWHITKKQIVRSSWGSQFLKFSSGQMIHLSHT